MVRKKQNTDNALTDLIGACGSAKDKMNTFLTQSRRVIKHPTVPSLCTDPTYSCHVADPKNAIDNVLVNVSGDEFNLNGAVAAGAFLWPVLDAELQRGQELRQIRTLSRSSHPDNVTQ